MKERVKITRHHSERHLRWIKNTHFTRQNRILTQFALKRTCFSFDSIRYLFYEGSPHICLSIRTALTAKTAPNKTPPGMYRRKKTGSTNSFSQTDTGEILKRNIDKSTIRVKNIWIHIWISYEYTCALLICRY
jgi:hypothetical protein